MLNFPHSAMLGCRGTVTASDSRLFQGRPSGNAIPAPRRTVPGP
jgi:hypothetical protein